MLTTKQLDIATAGGDDFIRTSKGTVVGLAIRLDLNPNAPDVIIVGKGIRREHRARLLEQHAGKVPTYLKRGVNAWEYIGDYGPYKYKDDAATVKRLVQHRRPNTVAGGLFLMATAAADRWSKDDEDARIANRGFPDAATRKEVEQVAVAHVWRSLEASGFAVVDRQTQNLGYDLLATKGRKTLFIEVKGTDATYPRFFLTRNEYRCSLLQGAWQLRVVTQARSSPQEHVFSAAQMDQVFTLDPMAWECTPK